jgi:hypothetical protein
MPRYITLPAETVELVNVANGYRVRRQTDHFETGGGQCANCGHMNRLVLEEDPPYTMVRWLEQFILVDQKLQVKTEEKNGREVNTPEGRKSMKLVAAVRKAFKGKAPGDEVVLDETYWETIKSVLDKPGNVWNMSQMAQFDAFFEAWYGATEESRSKKARAQAQSQDAIPVIENEDSAERTRATQA